MKRIASIVALGLYSFSSFAFKCYVTLVKDSCWANYNVSVDIVDEVSKKKVVDTLEIPKGKSWVRETFDCKPKQSLIYYANYSPNIWENAKARTFTSKRIWYLPEKAKKNEVAWNIPICYGRDFSSVPLPPEVDGNCQCDFKSVAKIQG